MIDGTVTVHRQGDRYAIRSKDIDDYRLVMSTLLNGFLCCAHQNRSAVAPPPDLARLLHLIGDLASMLEGHENLADALSKMEPPR